MLDSVRMLYIIWFVRGAHLFNFIVEPITKSIRLRFVIWISSVFKVCWNLFKVTSRGWHCWDTRTDRALDGTAADHSSPQSTFSLPHIASTDMNSRCEYSFIHNYHTHFWNAYVCWAHRMQTQWRIADSIVSIINCQSNITGVGSYICCRLCGTHILPGCAFLTLSHS